MDYTNDIPASLAVSAYSGTSFSPERRGETARQGYAAELQADYELFRQQAEKGGTFDKLDDEFSRYRAKYASLYRAYLASSSRCVSSFIAGPSNFPARRMNKRADVAHKRLDELFDFRDRAKKAIIRNLRPDLAPIRASDANAVERYEAELAKLERLQATMNAANKAIRANKKAGEAEQIAALVVLGLSESTARQLLKPDFAGRIGFPSYALTNNSANIRRIKERIQSITQAQETPETTTEGANATVDDCPADNRVRLTFPGKPSEDVRAKLKSNGFRWSPSLGVWQAYRNVRSIDFAKQIAGVTA